MSSLELTSKFDSLPDDLRVVAAEFIDFLLKKNKARGKTNGVKNAILKTSIPSNEPPKKESLAHLFGAWEDDRSPEEIIKNIREARFRVEKSLEF